MTKAKTKKTPHLFLDRDGVLVVDHHYVHKLQDLEIFPDVPEALRLARSLGFRIVVVTNQSGIARGYFTLEDTEAFHAEMDRQLQLMDSACIDHYYICPHHPKGSVAPYAELCNCRKPKPGLLMQADKDVPVDWQSSVLIGDKISDIECAHSQGMAGIQLDRGQYPIHQKAEAVTDSLLKAVEQIAQQWRKP